MAFDPFNPENNYEGTGVPFPSMMGGMPPPSSSNFINPGYLQAFSGMPQREFPSPHLYTPPSTGVFWGPQHRFQPGGFGMMAPPSPMQSTLAMTGITPPPMNVMPIAYQQAASRNLATSGVSAAGSTISMGLMGLGAGIGMSMGGIPGALIGGSIGGLAATATSAATAATLGRMQNSNRIQQETRGIVTAGSELDSSGRGLNMTGSNDLYSQFRQSAAKNVRFNTTDLQNLMSASRQENLFQFSGQTSKDVGKAVDNIRKLMETTMDIVEAVDMQGFTNVIGKLQRQGFKVNQMTTTTRTMRKFALMAGTGFGELMQAEGAAGAAAFQQAGLMAGSGTMAGGQAAGLINQLSRRGAIDSTTLSMAGGPQGAAAASAQGTAQFLSGPFQAVLPAILTSAGGKLQIDPDKLRQFASGKMTMEQALKDQSSLMTGGRMDEKKLQEFMRNSGRLTSAAYNSLSAKDKLGLESQGYLAVQRAAGGSSRIDIRSIMMGQGMSEAQAEIDYQRLFSTESQVALREADRQEKIEIESKRRQQQRFEASPLTKLTKWGRSVGNSIEATLGKPASYISRFLDNNAKEATGNYRTPEASRRGSETRIKTDDDTMVRIAGIEEDVPTIGSTVRGGRREDMAGYLYNLFGAEAARTDTASRKIMGEAGMDVEGMDNAEIAAFQNTAYDEGKRIRTALAENRDNTKNAELLTKKKDMITEIVATYQGQDAKLKVDMSNKALVNIIKSKDKDLTDDEAYAVAAEVSRQGMSGLTGDEAGGEEAVDVAISEMTNAAVEGLGEDADKKRAERVKAAGGEARVTASANMQKTLGIDAKETKEMEIAALAHGIKQKGYSKEEEERALNTLSKSSKMSRGDISKSINKYRGEAKDEFDEYATAVQTDVGGLGATTDSDIDKFAKQSDSMEELILGEVAASTKQGLTDVWGEKVIDGDFFKEAKARAEAGEEGAFANEAYERMADMAQEALKGSKTGELVKDDLIKIFQDSKMSYEEAEIQAGRFTEMSKTSGGITDQLTDVDEKTQKEYREEIKKSSEEAVGKYDIGEAESEDIALLRVIADNTSKGNAMSEEQLEAVKKSQQLQEQGLAAGMYTGSASEGGAATGMVGKTSVSRS